MDDQTQVHNLEVSGAGGGGGGRSAPPTKQVVNQTVVVQNPSRQPVIAANNLFSVAFAKTVYATSEGVLEGFLMALIRTFTLMAFQFKTPMERIISMVSLLNQG